MKVGDPIWRFDQNRRKYSKPNGGRLHGKIIYRAHWEPLTVIGETSRSWLVGPAWKPYKVSKKGAFGWAFSQVEVDQDVWLAENKHLVCEMLRRLDSKEYEKVRQVADLLGYQDKPEEVEG